jgi:hypothetical protein
MSAVGANVVPAHCTVGFTWRLINVEVEKKMGHSLIIPNYYFGHLVNLEEIRKIGFLKSVISQVPT